MPIFFKRGLKPAGFIHYRRKRNLFNNGCVFLGVACYCRRPLIYCITAHTQLCYATAYRLKLAPPCMNRCRSCPKLATNLANCLFCVCVCVCGSLHNSRVCDADHPIAQIGNCVCARTLAGDPSFHMLCCPRSHSFRIPCIHEQHPQLLFCC